MKSKDDRAPTNAELEARLEAALAAMTDAEREACEANDHRALEAQRAQWQAEVDAMPDDEYQAALEAERQAMNDIALDSPAVRRSDGSWVAPSELLGDDPPAQPDYADDDEVAQGYLKLMRSKGIDNPLPLWGQTVSIAPDGTVLWMGPDRVFHPLTTPGGFERWQARSERIRREQEQREAEDGTGP
ncbi:MAG: hypothetical protein OXC13_12765 [Caldilineaceae bacterium]|nr:hypothetical protein [Caldilineaceae bacterium]